MCANTPWYHHWFCFSSLALRISTAQFSSMFQSILNVVSAKRTAVVLLICSFNLHLWMHQFKFYFSSVVFRSVAVLLCSAAQGSEEVTANSVTPKPPHFWTVCSESFNNNTSGKLILSWVLVFYQIIWLSFSVKCSTIVVCLFLSKFFFLLHFTTFPFFIYETGLVASSCKQQGEFLGFSGKY